MRTLAYKVLKFFDDLTSAVVAVLLMLLAVYAGYACGTTSRCTRRRRRYAPRCWS